MFKIPDDIGGIKANRDQRVVIVSFFGKSSLLSRGCKAGVIDEALGRRIFRLPLVEDSQVDEDCLCDIKAYHDIKRRVIYLHLQGSFDVQTLIHTYGSLEKELEDEGYLSVWARLKYSYARVLLYLFCVSHVLICVHPTHIFDMSYIHLFRALDSVRLKSQSLLGESFMNVPNVSKEWIQVGRLCTPRLLFLFESCPALFRNAFSKGNNSSSICQSVKKLEHSLEDQIYFVLRKNRIITKNSSTSLFAIPANQEFVYVQTSIEPLKDWKSTLMNSLVDLCVGPNAGCAISKDNYCTNLQAISDMDVSHGKTAHLSQIVDSNLFHKDCTTPVSKLMGINTLEHTFKNFLEQHIEQAHLKGFDDNVSRHAVPAHFEIPTLGAWLDVASETFKFLVSEEKWNSSTGHLSSLLNLLNTDVKFSEGRCGKVLPLAIATYQEKLPAHYTREYHKGRLAHALSVFAVHARGPLFERYARQLETDCEAHWRDGRQMCQVLSLTGHPCTNPLHTGGGEGAGGGELGQLAEQTGYDTSQLPLMEHCSGVRYISACNCGRKQGPRDDPFSVRAANCDFYTLLGKECGCCHLENVQFPVFVPSTKDFRAAKLFSGTSKETSCSPHGADLATGTTGSNTQGYSLAEAMLRLPSAFVSGQSGSSDITAEEEEDTNNMNRNGSGPETAESAIVIHVRDNESDANDKGLVRQPSTTEYLPGMLHTESPSGLLPQFQSWSLVCLGPSSLYSHNLGLQEQQQAGLLPGSAFLLPWDLTVRLEHQRERPSPNIWPAVGDPIYGRGKTPSNVLQRPRKTKRDGAEFVVKIFIGVEYECPRGHRFMCSAPDKVLKTVGSGIVKDTGNKVTGSDMPLYFPCPCKTTKPLIAQLMRVHVVTPKAPVHVTLNPRVQPAPAPCPVFVPGNEECVKLSQSAYWVLRLPYVYVGEHGPYIAPKEPVPLNYGRLLAGMYGITEVVPHEK